MLQAVQSPALPIIVHCLPHQEGYDVYACAVHVLPNKLISKLEDGMLELRSGDSGGESTRIVYDPMRGYLATILEEFSKGKLQHRYKIRYQSDRDVGFFPSGWSYEDYDFSGKLVYRSEARIQNYEVNVPIAADELEFDLTRGTVVFGDGPTPYILSNHGEKVLLSESELMMPYDEKLKLIDEQKRTWKQWAFYGPILLLCVFVGWLVFRASQKRPLA